MSKENFNTSTNKSFLNNFLEKLMTETLNFSHFHSKENEISGFESIVTAETAETADADYKISSDIYSSIDSAIKECKTNIDDSFFKNLFKEIDESNISDEHKSKVKSFFVKYIVYRQVKNDNSKADQIINDVFNNISKKDDFDIYINAVKGAILGLDRSESCKEKVRDMVSLAIFKSEADDKTNFAKSIINSVSNLASKNIRAEFLDITREAYKGVIKSLPKNDSLANAIEITRDLISDPKIKNLKPQLSKAIGEDLYNFTKNYDYKKVNEEICKHEELSKNNDFIDGFNNELKKQEVLTKSLQGLAIGFGVGVCMTSLGAGIIATTPALLIIAGIAVAGATAGAGIGYAVGQINELQLNTKLANATAVKMKESTHKSTL